MVMETPSPQSVGREFVRQYYTLLHEAPLHLHRFYSNNSSFVHGGVEKPGEEQPPVMGQAEIHKKIMSLNFRDCHAKIRQVDSQGTVGSAVVVQVTGELSNNGQPMRRFMQTFVLAPQSAKKYYVHNDIFRYQDEVFIDSDTDTENQEEIVDSEPEATDGGVISSEPITDGNQQYFEQPPPMSNGTMHLEERTESPAQKSIEEEEGVDDYVPDEVGDGDEEEQGHEDPEEEYHEKEEEDEEPEDTHKTEDVEPEEPLNEPKPFSWAALASKNTQNTSNHPSGITNQGPQPVSKTPPQGFGNGRQESLKTETSPAAPQPQRNSRPPRGRERDRQSVTRDSDIDSDGQGGRRGSRYPDSHQLFVGNLPHNITEKELKAFFEKHGNVMELRINTKSSGGKLPNFGFVVFDSPDPVQQILSMKPIKYNGEHRLNVEEKKPRVGDGRLGSGRGPIPRSGSAGGGSGGGFGRGVGRGGGGGTRTGGPPTGIRGENRGGPNRGGMTGPRR